MCIAHNSFWYKCEKIKGGEFYNQLLKPCWPLIMVPIFKPMFCCYYYCCLFYFNLYLNHEGRGRLHSTWVTHQRRPTPHPPTLRAPFLTQFITERLLLTRCSVALLRHSVSYVSAKHPHPPVANVRHLVSNLCE